MTNKEVLKKVEETIINNTLDKIHLELFGLAVEYEKSNKDIANGIYKSIAVLDEFKNKGE